MFSIRRLLSAGLAGMAFLLTTGCLDDIKESARGMLPFMPPSKYIDRGGRKLTRKEAALYQKLTDLSRAIKINPKDAVAYNAIGELLMKNGAYLLAKRCFRDAIDRDPELSEPHHNLGTLMLLEYSYHMAMDELKKAAKYSSEDARIRMRLGQAHMALGQIGEAMSEFDEGISLDNEYTPVYLEKARLQYSLRNYAEGAETCRKALEHIPPWTPPIAAKAKQTNVGFLDKILPGQQVVEDETPPPSYKQEAAYDLALCLKAQGLYGEALSALVQAEGAEDARLDVGVLRAKLEDLQGNTSSAIGTLSLLRTTFPEHAEIPKLQAKFYEKTGQADLAIKTRIEAAELDHSDKDLQEEAARDAETKHNRARTIAIYERLVRIDPDGLPNRIKLAQAYDDIGIRREAALAWQEVINLRARLVEQSKRDGPDSVAARDINMPPSDYEVRRRTGMLYAEMPGFQGKAMFQFKHCLQIQPEDPEVHRMMGELCLEMKNYGDAETHIRQTLKVSPNDAKSHHNLANLHAAQSRYDDAVAEYRSAIKLDPQLDVAHLNLAKVLLGQNRREEALEPLKTYTQLKPLDVESRKMLAGLYKDLNRKDLAIQELDAVYAMAEAEGSGVAELLQLDAIKWEIGDKNIVISDLETQLGKFPSDLRLLISAARYYTEMKSHTKAIYTWERVRNVSARDENAPYRIEANNKLAQEYLATGREDLAIRASEDAGKEGDPEGLRRAAELHLKKNDLKETAKAIANYREILKQRTQDVDARKRLATLLQTSEKIAEREEAMTLYKEAVGLAPKDEGAHVNYANLLADFNRFTEALEEFDITLRLNPKNTAALVGHGVVMRKKARYKDALDDYLKAIEADPNLKVAYFNVAIIYDYYLPNPEKAKLYYDEYIKHGGDPAKLNEPQSNATPKKPPAEAKVVVKPARSDVADLIPAEAPAKNAYEKK